MIHCRAAEELITGYIDGELTADELAAIDEHLAQCPACRDRVINERETKNLVGRAHEPRPAPDMARRRIMDAIFGKPRTADASVPKLAPNAGIKPVKPESSSICL